MTVPVCKYNTNDAVNPLCPSVTNSSLICQNFDFKMSRDHKKISYERRDYETVDEKSLS